MLAGEQLAGLKIAIRPGIELSGRVSGSKSIQLHVGSDNYLDFVF